MTTKTTGVFEVEHIEYAAGRSYRIAPPRFRIGKDQTGAPVDLCSRWHREGVHRPAGGVISILAELTWQISAENSWSPSPGKLQGRRKFRRRLWHGGCSRADFYF